MTSDKTSGLIQELRACGRHLTRVRDPSKADWCWKSCGGREAVGQTRRPCHEVSTTCGSGWVLDAEDVNPTLIRLLNSYLARDRRTHPLSQVVLTSW